MTTPKRKCRLYKISQLFDDFSYIRLSNLKFFEWNKTNFIVWNTRFALSLLLLRICWSGWRQHFPLSKPRRYATELRRRPVLDWNFPAYSVKPGIAGFGVHWVTAEIFKSLSIFQLSGTHIREVKFMKGFKRSLLHAVGSLQRSIMTKAKRVSEGCTSVSNWHAGRQRTSNL